MQLFIGRKVKSDTVLKRKKLSSLLDDSEGSEDENETQPEGGRTWVNCSTLNKPVARRAKSDTVTLGLQRCVSQLHDLILYCHSKSISYFNDTSSYEFANIHFRDASGSAVNSL